MVQRKVESNTHDVCKMLTRRPDIRVKKSHQRDDNAADVTSRGEKTNREQSSLYP